MPPCSLSGSQFVWQRWMVAFEPICFVFVFLYVLKFFVCARVDMVYCKFLLYVSLEINPFKRQYFSTQINLVYLGLVYMTMITGTRSYSTVVRGLTGV